MPGWPGSLTPLRDLKLNTNDPTPRCWSGSDLKEAVEAKHWQDEQRPIPAAPTSHTQCNNPFCYDGPSEDIVLGPDFHGCLSSSHALQSSDLQVGPLPRPLQLQGASASVTDEARDHLTSLRSVHNWTRRTVSFNSASSGKKATSDSLQFSMSKLGPLVRSFSNLSAIELENAAPLSPSDIKTSSGGTNTKSSTTEFGPRDSADHESLGKHSHGIAMWRSATKIGNSTLQGLSKSLSRSATSALSNTSKLWSQKTTASKSGLTLSHPLDKGHFTGSPLSKMRPSYIGSFLYDRTSLDDHFQWRFLCPDNRSLVMLFPSGNEKLGISGWVTVMLMNPLLAALVCILLSNMYGMGIGDGFLLYEVLVRGATVRYPLLGTSVFSTFFLHAADIYKWNVHFGVKCVPAFAVFYLWIATGVCFTMEWPFMPLAIAMLHLPLTIMFFRMSKFRMSYTVWFYNGVSVSCFITALLLVGLWLTWVFTADRGWTPGTKEWLQSYMGGLHAAYGLQNWNECKDVADKTECAKLELIAFLVWACPLFQGVAYLLMAGICHFRAWFLSKHEFKQFSIIISVATVSIVVLIGAFWVCMSFAGADAEISSAILLIIGVCALSLCVWTYSSLVISDLVEYTVQMPIVMALKPMVNSDEFKGCALCCAVGLVIPFIFCEILVRIFQRIFLCRNGEHPLLTARALHLVNGVQGWHWGSVLEQAFLWSVFFVVFWICGGQLAIVFSVWLREKLFALHFAAFWIIFVFVKLILFLFPPIPGMLIYLSTSIALVSKVKDAELDGYGFGLTVAGVSSLFLKMAAFCLEQRFGRLLAKSLRVQRAWGPRNTWSRAIECILNAPGMSIEKSIKKSLLVVGGPDWPCGVLLGIIPVGTKQPLIHMLPCTVIIGLATLSGAWMLEEKVKTAATVLIRLATMLQGVLMTLACLLVLSVMHHQAEELQQARSDLELVNKYVQRNAKSARIYILCTEWDTLGYSCKFLLLTGTGVEILSCWVFFFCSSACFRGFDLNSDFDGSFSENGLEGNWLNIFRPLGVMCLSSAVLGWILMIIYYVMVDRRTKQVMQGAEVHQRLASRLATSGRAMSSVHSGTSRTKNASNSSTGNFRASSGNLRSSSGNLRSSSGNLRSSLDSRLSVQDVFRLLSTIGTRASTGTSSTSPFTEYDNDHRVGSSASDNMSFVHTASVSTSSRSSMDNFRRGTPCKLESNVLQNLRI